MSTTLTIRIDDKTKQRLERLAEATARSKSYLVSSAINGFIEANEWQIRAIKEAVKKSELFGKKLKARAEKGKITIEKE